MNFEVYSRDMLIDSDQYKRPEGNQTHLDIFTKS
jgi:hypothetical protein